MLEVEKISVILDIFFSFFFFMRICNTDESWLCKEKIICLKLFTRLPKQKFRLLGASGKYENVGGLFSKIFGSPFWGILSNREWGNLPVDIELNIVQPSIRRLQKMNN